jgi:predicted dehydrogenase
MRQGACSGTGVNQVQMSNNLRIGIIGCGIGDYHAEAYLLDKRAEVVSLAGLDVPRCLEVCKKHSIPEHSTNYEDLLSRADIDAVSIAVPNFLHAPIAIAALRAGKHVLLEKPIGLNAHEGEQIVAEAKAANRILGICFNKRYRADVELLKSQALSGALGEIYYAKAFWMRRAGIPGLGTWFTNKSLSGGGSLIDLGVHVIDMVLWLMGNPKISTVSAATYSKLGPKGRGHWAGARFQHSTENAFEVDDLTAAFMRTETGATIHLETSWATNSAHTDDHGVILFGDEGGAEVRIHDYQKSGALKFFNDVNGIPVDSQPRTIVHHEHQQVVKRFIDAITLGVPMTPSGEEGVDRARVVDAIYESAAAGREITINQPAAATASAAD